MSTVSVSPDQLRLRTYDTFSAALGYPDSRFFEHFPTLLEKKDEIVSEYDSIFRNRGVWLYTTEYTAKGQFQKTEQLSDIMGFYKAFGLNIERERPDALTVELEFMHYLIFKALFAGEKQTEDAPEKVQLCVDAQRKFFDEHLNPGAREIKDKITSTGAEVFYADIFEELMTFLEDEESYFASQRQASS